MSRDWSLLTDRRDCIKLLAAAGFTREKVTDIEADKQLTYVAGQVLGQLEGDPFVALARMAPEQKASLRGGSTGSFEEFMTKEV